jgi:hypothetical protein
VAERLLFSGCQPPLEHEDEPDQWVAKGFSTYWYLCYHTLFWLDLYLTGAEEGFTPPAPFNLVEMEANETLPIIVYPGYENSRVDSKSATCFSQPFTQKTQTRSKIDLNTFPITSLYDRVHK